MLSEKLKFHPFSVAVWGEAAPIQKELEEKGLDVDSEDIDEYQFYVMRVGYSLAHLITWIEQLEHAVYYLSDFSYSKEAKIKGVSRSHHLLYNVENYLIRLQSIYDRALQLTNKVFHLLIEESNISHSVIVSNLKVSRTKISSLLKSLQRSIKAQARERHEIVHRNSYQDPQLRRLELFYMFDEDTWKDEPGKPSFQGLSHMRSQLLKQVVAEKKKEFSDINESLFEKVDLLLLGLHEQYNKESLRLKLYVYGTSAYRDRDTHR